ncbi:hypothetical protein FQN49_005168 [Arthroderma sp. PD_2]|nr:hypothetical protein FQN49_005168 [Arthroderma sp. PD_2]
MTCFRPLFSAAQALRCTFIASESQAVQTTKRLHALPTQQLRYYQSSPTLRISPSPCLSYPPPRSRTPRPIRDESIPSATVVIVQDNGELGPPMPLKTALTQFNRSLNFLVQVSPKAEGRPAVCKVVNKADYNKDEQERKGAGKPKSTGVQIKQIELNWAIDPHDLSHRLGQLETFLEKGKRVSLILTKKRNKRRATPDEAQRVLASIEEKMFEIGVAEVKPRKGKILERIEYVLDKKKPKA